MGDSDGVRHRSRGRLRYVLRLRAHDAIIRPLRAHDAISLLQRVAVAALALYVLRLRAHDAIIRPLRAHDAIQVLQRVARRCACAICATTACTPCSVRCGCSPLHSPLPFPLRTVCAPDRSMLRAARLHYACYDRMRSVPRDYTMHATTCSTLSARYALRGCVNAPCAQPPPPVSLYKWYSCFLCRCIKYGIQLFTHCFLILIY